MQAASTDVMAMAPFGGLVEVSSSRGNPAVLSRTSSTGAKEKEKEIQKDEEKVIMRRKNNSTGEKADAGSKRRKGLVSMEGIEEFKTLDDTRKRRSAVWAMGSEKGERGVGWYQSVGETNTATKKPPAVKSPYPSASSLLNASQGNTRVPSHKISAITRSSSISTLGGVGVGGGAGDLSPPTMSQMEGYGLDESVLMNPTRFAILKANMDAFMSERQRQLVGTTAGGGGVVLNTDNNVGAGVGTTKCSNHMGAFKVNQDFFHHPHSETCQPRCNNSNPEMSFGNFGFGSSVRASTDDIHQLNKLQEPVLYRALKKIGLGCVYDKRSQIKITIFSLLAILASFLYMTPGYQITERTFLTLTQMNPSSRVEIFPSNGAQIFHEVSFKLTGLFKDSSYDVINSSTPHIRVRLCNKTSSMTSSSSSLTTTSWESSAWRRKDCFADNNLTILANTHSQSAQVVKWTQKLKRVPHTSLYVDLVNFPAFSFMMDFSLSGDASRMEVVVAAVILLLFYFLVITEVFHRTVAAMLSSTVALAALSVMGKGPRINDVMRWIEWETLMLLFGMMILVAIFAESGFFDRMSLFAFKLARGRVWPLIYILCTVTGIMSAILDNVTTILLMAPVSLNLCEVLNVDPKWVLIALVIISNVGGTATAIGDLPNVLIVSNESLQSRGIDLGSFTVHLFLGSFVAAFFAMLTLQYLYRNKNFGSVEDAEIRAWETELRMWRQTMARVGSISREEKAVRGMLMVHMGNLWASMNNHRQQLNRNSQNKSRDHTTRPQKKEEEERPQQHQNQEEESQWLLSEPEPEPVWMSKYEELKVTYVIRDYSLLAKSGLLIIAVVLMFVLQSTNLFPSTELGLIAILGSVVLLLLTDIDDIEDILHKVEWATLIFFAAEFVLMQALREMRMLETVAVIAGDTLASVVPPSLQFPVALLLMLWLSALVSSLIDNIPFTKTMIPLLVDLCDANPNIHLKPMVYALAFGACFGGNGSLIGASSNVVCAGIAENKGTKICFGEFFCIGFPIMTVTTFVAMLYLTFCHLYFQWDNF